MMDLFGTTAVDLTLPATPRGIDEQRRLSGKSPLVVAREFEAILVAQMIAAMRKTVGSGGLLAASATNRMLDGAFDHEVARSLTSCGDFGIAPQIAAQLERRGWRPKPGPADGGQDTPATSPSSGVAPGMPAGGTPLGSGPGAARAASGTVDGVAGGVASAWHSAPLGSVDGAPAVAPVDGVVSSAFGARRDPLTGRRRFHAGIDIVVPRGASIRAVAAGEVVFSGWRGGAGNVVEVRHGGGLVTRYAHAERTLVRAGQRIAAGDIVGTVGSSGRTTGPHLHFTVLKDGQPIDPARILGSDPTTVEAQARVAGEV